MSIKEIGEKDFEEEVLKSKIPVVIDFWAVWCGPCRIFSPIIEEVSKDYEGRVKFVKINADESPNLNEKYSVMGIPTVCMIKNGSLKSVNVGAVPKETLKKWIDKNV